MRTLAMPHITKFDELFERWEYYYFSKKSPSGDRYRPREVCETVGHVFEWDVDIAATKYNLAHKEQHKMFIETFATVRRVGSRYHLRLWARKEVYEAIGRNTIGVEDDYMNFEIIEWSGKNTALVLCHHGKIIGDVWIAKISPDSIPPESNKDMYGDPEG